MNHYKYYWIENAWAVMKGINGTFNDLDELKDYVFSKWKFSNKYDKFYIASIGKVKPGMDLNDYVCGALNNKFKPIKYYNKI